MERKEERVNHPSHYNTDCPETDIMCPSCGGKINHILECIEVIRNMPTWKGNAIKYLWRAGLKKEAALSDVEKEIEDLEKAKFYIDDRISYLKGPL